MKKILMFSTIIIIMVCVFTACGGDMGNDIENGAENAADTARNVADSVGDTVKRTADGVTNAVENTAENMGNNMARMGQNVDTSGFVGEARAKEIALNKAGLKNEDVEFVKVKLDKDDDIWQYEVEFTHNKTEYDADIKAEDGAILSWDIDYNE